MHMRISNGLRKIENGVIFLGRKAKSGLQTVGVAARVKRHELKIDILAARLAATQRDLNELNALDARSVEQRVADIQKLADATAVRKQEQKLRNEIAEAVKDGRISLGDVTRFDVALQMRKVYGREVDPTADEHLPHGMV